MTCTALFTLTRLDGIPRSTPFIHALILAAGLVASRTLTRILADDRNNDNHEGGAAENVVMIGSNQFSSLYIKLLRACAPKQRRVVALLDREPAMLGRAIEGVPIVGAPRDLDSIIGEYALHGIEVDRVMVGGDCDILSVAEIEEVKAVCESRQIGLDFMPQLVGMVGPKMRP